MSEKTSNISILPNEQEVYLYIVEHGTPILMQNDTSLNNTAKHPHPSRPKIVYQQFKPTTEPNGFFSLLIKKKSDSKRE